MLLLIHFHVKSVLDVVELGCVKAAVRVVTIFLFVFFFYGMNSWLRVNQLEANLEGIPFLNY